MLGGLDSATPHLVKLGQLGNCHFLGDISFQRFACMVALDSTYNLSVDCNIWLNHSGNNNLIVLCSLRS